LNIKNPSTGWKEVASIKEKRHIMGAALYNDLIVVAGGGNERNFPVSSVEIYQTSCNECKSICSLNEKRAGHALVSCGRYLYVLGGCDGRRTYSSVERLDGLNGKWIKIKSMQTPRMSFSAVNCDGVIYVTGGLSKLRDFSTNLKSVERYNSATNKWMYVSDMNIKRRGHSACVLRNKIYVVGGFNGEENQVNEIECYDPTCDTWSIVGNITEKLLYHTTVAV